MPRVSLEIPNFYSNEVDSQARLNGTFNRYQGRFYLFTTIGSGQFALTDILSGGVVKKIRINDPDIDISVPHLGYYNRPAKKHDTQGVGYIFRPPVRGAGYQQGINSHNLRVRTICGENCMIKAAYEWEFILPSLYGEFTSLEESRQKKQFALSRDVAFWRIDPKETLVFLKCDLIGRLVDDQTVVCQSRTVSRIAEPYLKEIGMMTEVSSANTRKAA